MTFIRSGSSKIGGNLGISKELFFIVLITGFPTAFLAMNNGTTAPEDCRGNPMGMLYVKRLACQFNTRAASHALLVFFS